MAKRPDSDAEESARIFLHKLEKLLEQNQDLGMDTKTAITTLQRVYGLPADGIPGPQTLEYLESLNEEEILQTLFNVSIAKLNPFHPRYKNQSMNETFSDVESNEHSEDELMPIPDWFVDIAKTNKWDLISSPQSIPPGLFSTHSTDTLVRIPITVGEMNYFFEGLPGYDYLQPEKNPAASTPVIVDVNIYTYVSGNEQDDDFSLWAMEQPHLVMRLSELKEVTPDSYIAELAGRSVGVHKYGSLGEISRLQRIIMVIWPDLVFDGKVLEFVEDGLRLGAEKNEKYEKKAKQKRRAKGRLDEKTDKDDEAPLNHTTDNKLSGYENDDIESRVDQLDVKSEVKALCGIAASREVKPPLSIGLFGDWGSGKSFFMKEMKACIKEMAEKANRAELARLNPDNKVREPVYWSNIAQISFNAWHYEDADLWASMVVNIFDQLAEHVVNNDDKSLSVEEKRIQLFEKIELIEEEVKHCDLKLAKTEEELKKANQEVTDREQAYDRAKNTLAGLDVGKVVSEAFSRFVVKSPDLRNRLNELGLESVAYSTESLQKLGKDLASDAGQIKAGIVPLFNLIKSAKGVGLLVVMLIVGIVGVAYGADYLLKGVLGDEIRKNFANLSGVLTSVGGYLLILKKWIAPVKDKVKEVQVLCQEFDGFLTSEEKDVKVNIENVKKIEEELNKQRKDRDKLIEEKNKLINEREKIRAGHRLYSFIEEQATSDKYRGKLGIIASIRKDFKQLSDYMVKQASEKRDAWDKPTDSVQEKEQGSKSGNDKDKKNKNKVKIADIDRIILYIDDLDRCTPERVVEVLHAVHLLLAFKLFVVVVAVDSRWLINSLKTSISNLTSEIIEEKRELDEENQEDDSLSSLDNLISTPQNYLEKIFQIPYTLPRMKKTGFEKIMQSLAQPESQKKKDTNQVSALTGERADDSDAIMGNQSVLANMPGVHEQKKDAPQAGEGEQVSNTQQKQNIPVSLASNHTNTPSDIQASTADDKTSSESEKNKEDKYEVDLNPPKSVIGDDELGYMKNAYYGLSTPRSVNRFVNTYRLIRSLVSEEQSAAFFRADGEYQQVIILLIVLIGFNQVAEEFFVELCKAGDRKKLLTFLDEFEKKANISNRHKMTRLKHALIQIPSTDKMTMAVLKKWAPLVSRYSFRSIRLDLSQEKTAAKKKSESVAKTKSK